MLPAWATVAISLGGSFLIALASIGVAYLTKKQESVAEWRNLLVDVAHEFSTAIGQAIRGVREAIRCFNEEDDLRDQDGHPIEPHQSAVGEAIRLVNEASDRLDRVLLLFGPDTKTGEPAAKAVELLRMSSESLRGYVEGFRDPEHTPEDLGQYLRSASDACTAADRKHVEFNRMARKRTAGTPVPVFRRPSRLN